MDWKALGDTIGYVFGWSCGAVVLTIVAAVAVVIVSGLAWAASTLTVAMWRVWRNEAFG